MEFWIALALAFLSGSACTLGGFIFAAKYVINRQADNKAA